MGSFDWNKAFENTLNVASGYFDKKFISDSNADQLRLYQSLIDNQGQPVRSEPSVNSTQRADYPQGGIPTWALVAGAGLLAYAVLK